MRPVVTISRSAVRACALLALLAALPLAGCERAPREAPDAAVAPPDEFAAEAGVAVHITDAGVTLSQDTVVTRNVELSVVNQSAHTYDFRVEGLGVQLGNIAPGTSSSIGVRLEPGSYEVVATPSDPEADAAPGEHRTTLHVAG